MVVVINFVFNTYPFRISNWILYAIVVQRLVYQPSKLGMRVRFPSVAPFAKFLKLSCVSQGQIRLNKLASVGLPFGWNWYMYNTISPDFDKFYSNNGGIDN